MAQGPRPLRPPVLALAPGRWQERECSLGLSCPHADTRELKLTLAWLHKAGLSLSLWRVRGVFCLSVWDVKLCQVFAPHLPTLLKESEVIHPSREALVPGLSLEGWGGVGWSGEGRANKRLVGRGWKDGCVQVQPGCQRQVG